MNAPAEIWAHGLSSADPGYGGWAYVVRHGAELIGAAGGRRRTGPSAMALTAVLEALDRLAADPTSPVTVRCNLPLAEDASEPALWARLSAVRAARAGSVTLAQQANPFTAAWAEEGQKRAKTRDGFTAAIPKPNLRSFKPAP